MFIATYTEIIDGVQWRIDFRPSYPGEVKLPRYNYYNYQLFASAKKLFTAKGAYLPGGLNEYDAAQWLRSAIEYYISQKQKGHS